MKDHGFLKLLRSEATRELLRDPLALHLLTVIALRARFTNEPSLHGLTFGQAFIGDHQEYGLTRKQSTCAQGRLARMGLAKFYPIDGKGTIATLCDSRVFALTDERPKKGQLTKPLIEQQVSEVVIPTGAPSNPSTRCVTGTAQGHLWHSNQIGKKDQIPCPGSTPATSDGERFVDWFLELLRETQAPVPVLTASNRALWAETYDKLIRLDGRTKEEIKSVCRWARTDSFWRSNFMSPSKLRHKTDGVMRFDWLLNKLRNPAKGGAPNSNGYDRPAPTEI